MPEMAQYYGCAGVFSRLSQAHFDHASPFLWCLQRAQTTGIVSECKVHTQAVPQVTPCLQPLDTHSAHNSHTVSLQELQNSYSAHYSHIGHRQCFLFTTVNSYYIQWNFGDCTRDVMVATCQPIVIQSLFLYILSALAIAQSHIATCYMHSCMHYRPRVLPP